MSTNHAIVWIDHTEAHVLMFDRAHVESQLIKSRRTFHKPKGGHVGSHQGKHGRGVEDSGKHSPAGGHSVSDEDYYHEVAQSLAGVHEILVTGPAMAKDEFRAHCKRHDKDIDKAIIDVVPSDHPSDPQLVAMAKKYFLKHDKMQGNPSKL
jgi:stalled ribosome rescue protein Dom34